MWAQLQFHAQGIFLYLFNGSALVTCLPKVYHLVVSGPPSYTISSRPYMLDNRVWATYLYLFYVLCASVICSLMYLYLLWEKVPEGSAFICGFSSLLIRQRIG